MKIQKMVISCEEDGKRKYIKSGFLGDKHLYTCTLNDAATFEDPLRVEKIMSDYNLPEGRVEVIEIEVTKEAKTLKTKYEIFADFAKSPKKYPTIVAMDIVNPFSKTLNIEKLEELLERITSEACLDKVGETVYKLTKNMRDYNREDVDNVVTFLNDLNQRKSTSQTVGFKLDLSEF